jgi:hypothetical protein
LIQTDWDGGGAETEDGEPAGYGDNSGARPAPEGGKGPEPEPDPVLPHEKVPVGWDKPGRFVNGVYHPPERIPTRADGRPWPTADPDGILRTLRLLGDDPVMRIYVPRDGIGPLLIGSNEKEEFERPSGYDVVYLRGLPQRTVSRGVETAHARESVAEALNFAKKNEYSDIFFNRSFSTISNGRYGAPFRADVVGLRRPTLDPTGEYDVYEVLSPRQSGPAREQLLRPAVSGIHSFDSRAYKLLLKLLRALGLS